jgi:undecaprenyl-diphosphatase
MMPLVVAAEEWTGMLDVFHAVLLGLVEGVTEFLPVSSTGHLIVVGNLLGFTGPKAATFDIFIQLGAILAVVVLYKERFASLWRPRSAGGFSGSRGLLLLALTTLPALLLGGVTHGLIKTYLFNSTTVALGLAIGGVAILLMERRKSIPLTVGLDALEWREALTVGFCQCLALWPGISRSAATILGGMAVGLERKTAAEYSFLAAVPVMIAATGLDLVKSLPILQSTDFPVFLIGFVTAFLAAWIAVKGLIQLLSRHTLKPFGWYRLAMALLIVGLLH